jgi:hypothetical protein
MVAIALDIFALFDLTVRWNEACSGLRSRLSNPTSTPGSHEEDIDGHRAGTAHQPA